MLAQCPRFESGDVSEFAEQGSVRHEALAACLESFRVLGATEQCKAQVDAVLELIDSDEDREAILWAAEYIQLHAPTYDYPLVIEQKATWTGPDFSERTGTPDFICGPVMFDFKWRRRDYTAQMADYACHIFDTMPSMGFISPVTVHILYGAEKRAEIIKFTSLEDCLRIVGEILERAENPASDPTPCDYCGWCARRLTCPALLKPVAEVIKHREGVTERDRELFTAWLESGAHTTTINDADTMGVVLRIARVVADFSEAAEHMAKEMLIKQGIVPTGFKRQERRGNRYISSVTAAFGKCGLPQDEFLKACDIKFSALVELHQALNGLKKPAAEREMEARLGDIVQRKAPSVSLVAEKEK